MSPNTVLRIEFFSCIFFSLLFGAWMVLSFQQWMKGDLTILWVLVTVFFAVAVGFDVYKTWKRILGDNSKTTVPP
jgi:hypothetical protein